MRESLTRVQAPNGGPDACQGTSVMVRSADPEGLLRFGIRYLAVDTDVVQQMVVQFRQMTALGRAAVPAGNTGHRRSHRSAYRSCR